MSKEVAFLLSFAPQNRLSPHLAFLLEHPGSSVENQVSRAAMSDSGCHTSPGQPPSIAVKTAPHPAREANGLGLMQIAVQRNEPSVKPLPAAPAQAAD